MAASGSLCRSSSSLQNVFHGGRPSRAEPTWRSDNSGATNYAGCIAFLHDRHRKRCVSTLELKQSSCKTQCQRSRRGGRSSWQRWQHQFKNTVSFVAYSTPGHNQNADSDLVETTGEVVFQRHRSKTKFQYATSLERLALGRLSSKLSEEAALAMGIEKVGEQETPVCVGFTVTKEGRGDLRLEGAVDTAIEIACARCACSVGVPVEGPFNLLLTCQPLKVVGRTVVGIVRGRKDQEVDDLEEAERVAGGQEEEAFDLDLDDKKFFPPEVAEIDLSEYIRETILLKIPIKVLCKDDCKGLCIDCGADWNKENCNCAQKRKLTEKVAPRTDWGPALAQLRETLRKES